MKRALLALLAAALPLIALGQTVPITGLPAGGAVAGTDVVPVVQGATTVKTTAAAVDTYVKTLGATLGVAKGGTNLTTATDDNTIVGNGTTWQSKALTDCAGATNAVTYSTATNAWGCNIISAGGTPGGSTTQVQYNNAGAFAGSGDFTWDNTNRILEFGAVTGGFTLRGGIGAVSITGGITGGVGQGVTVGGRSGTGAGGGGVLTLRGGAGSGAGVAGNVTVTGGNSGGSSTTPGSVTIAGGSASSGGFGGDVLMQASQAGSNGSAGGGATLQSGAGNGTASNGGPVAIIAGVKGSTGTDGAITFTQGGLLRAQFLGTTGVFDIASNSGLTSSAAIQTLGGASIIANSTGRFFQDTAGVGAPGFSSVTDTDTGIYISTGNINTVNVACGGVNCGVISATRPVGVTGSYTPTCTINSNLDACTPTVSNWYRVGDMIHVAMVMTVDPTAAGSTQARLSLPVASNFTANTDASGTCVSNTSNSDTGTMVADTTNDNLNLIFNPTNVGSFTFPCMIDYRVQ